MLIMLRPRNNLLIHLHRRAARRQFELLQQFRNRDGPSDVAALPVDKNHHARLPLSTAPGSWPLAPGYFRIAALRDFHFPASVIGVIWATPAAVAAFVHGNV